MKDHIFEARMSNRAIKLQYVAKNLGVAVAMSNNNQDLNEVATELSYMISEERMNNLSTTDIDKLLLGKEI